MNPLCSKNRKLDLVTKLPTNLRNSGYTFKNTRYVRSFFSFLLVNQFVCLVSCISRRRRGTWQLALALFLGNIRGLPNPALGSFHFTLNSLDNNTLMDLGNAEAREKDHRRSMISMASTPQGQPLFSQSAERVTYLVSLSSCENSNFPLFPRVLQISKTHDRLSLTMWWYLAECCMIMALCAGSTKGSKWSTETCQSGVVVSSLGWKMVARDIRERRTPTGRHLMLVGLSHACSERALANEHWVFLVSARA